MIFFLQHKRPFLRWYLFVQVLPSAPADLAEQHPSLLFALQDLCLSFFTFSFFAFSVEVVEAVCALAANPKIATRANKVSTFSFFYF